MEVTGIATYVISDIHGEYDLFLELLDKIRFSDEDTLYILGDILDRGPHPIKALLKIMEMPNAVCIIGNHEVMALDCLEFLMEQIKDTSIKGLSEDLFEKLLNWRYNGCRTTVDEFRALDRETQREVIDFIRDFPVYEELEVNGKNYLLVHAGLGNYYPGRPIEDYSLDELVWYRAEYNIQYYEDKYVVTGHTPTQMIRDNPRPGYIYRNNNHIAIDCGAFLPEGRLAAICLESGETFYSSEYLYDDEESFLGRKHRKGYK